MTAPPLPAMRPLRDRKPPDRDLAGTRIGLCIERDFLALLQRRDTRALEGGSVYEHVSAAVIRLNEAETLVGIVEFHGAVRHDDCPFADGVHVGSGTRFRGQFRFYSNLESV